MFTIFFCGWAPIYILLVINFDGTAVSSITLQILAMMAAVSLFIDVVDLFLYNHELWKYFINRWQIDPDTRPRKRRRKGL
jgi:membrane protein YdbS with pleckstrin-like domain